MPVEMIQPHTTATSLDLEARGELKRINRNPPQRLVRTQPTQGGTR